MTARRSLLQTSSSDGVNPPLRSTALPQPPVHPAYTHVKHRRVKPHSHVFSHPLPIDVYTENAAIPRHVKPAGRAENRGEARQFGLVENYISKCKGIYYWLDTYGCYTSHIKHRQFTDIRKLLKIRDRMRIKAVFKRREGDRKRTKYM